MSSPRLVPGKLPESLLSSFLQQLTFKTDRVITPPAIGEDTGALELENGDLLVYTSDPVTFTSSGIGRSSVIINANDIATSGGKPQWFLSTLLVPPGEPVSLARAILNDIAQTCRSMGITLAGGHTEVTDSVTRPVVSGTMFAIVKKNQYIDKKNTKAGDTVILTKTAGLEGTAVLAEELKERLLLDGLSADELDLARSFIENISVLPDAEIAVETGTVTGMHDVTEGGAATALRELGSATGRELLCDKNSIPVHPVTRKMCTILDIDPFGLLGSGSLLICCKPWTTEAVIRGLHEQGIDASVVGSLGKRGSSIPDLPEFLVDEITKVL